MISGSPWHTNELQGDSGTPQADLTTGKAGDKKVCTAGSLKLED